MTRDHLAAKENQACQVFLVLVGPLVQRGHLETEVQRVDRELLAGMVTLEHQVMCVSESPFYPLLPLATTQWLPFH